MTKFSSKMAATKVVLMEASCDKSAAKMNTDRTGENVNLDGVAIEISPDKAGIKMATINDTLFINPDKIKVELNPDKITAERAPHRTIIYMYFIHI